MSEGRDQWYVITGPPCCGKSTTIELLAQRGFRVRSEIARAYVDEEISKGRTTKEIRADMRTFQCEVLLRAIASEEDLPRDERIFLDRAVPDSLAYLMLYGIPTQPYMHRIISSKYKTVFYLEPLNDYTTDYARIENSGERDQLTGLLWKVYNDLEFSIQRVPMLPQQDRIDYILGCLA